MMIYPAGSISKGMLANAYVLNEAPPLVETFDGTFIRAHHVYDLDETIGTQNFLDKVLHKNRRMQLQKISLLETFAPERLVLAPIAFQGAISVAGQPNFDLGSKRRDKGFMQLWTPTIREKIDVIYRNRRRIFLRCDQRPRISRSNRNRRRSAQTPPESRYALP